MKNRLLLFFATLFFATGANVVLAADYDVIKTWDFAAIIKANGYGDKTACAGNGVARIGGIDCDKITTTGLEGLALQGAGGWLLRTSNELQNNNSGGRVIGFLNDALNLQTNDVIVVTANAQPTVKANCTFLNAEGKVYSFLITEGGADAGLDIARGEKISKIELKRPQEIAADKISKYTVKYMFGEQEIKDAAKREGVIGEKASLMSSDKEAVSTSAMKYIYVSDDAADVVLEAEGSVITVKFREASKYHITVKTSDNVGGEVLYNDDVWENTDVYSGYPKYLLVNDKLYNSKQAGYNTTNWYEFKFTVAQKDVSEEISYAPSEISNVFYYSEGEKINTLTKNNPGFANARCSNGFGGYAPEAGVVITQLPAGKYKVGGAAYCGSSTAVTITLKVGETETLSLSSGGSLAAGEGAEFELTEAANLVVKDAGSANCVLDYVYVIDMSKVLKLTAPVVNDLGKTGFLVTWATGTENAQTSDMEIYYSIKRDGTVQAEKKLDCANIDNVGYGAYIKDLKTSDDVTVYAKTTNAYLFSNSDNVTLTATVDTGIEAPAAAQSKDGVIYDLQGRRVSRPNKGLYIQNGKLKVVR